MRGGGEHTREWRGISHHQQSLKGGDMTKNINWQLINF